MNRTFLIAFLTLCISGIFSLGVTAAGAPRALIVVGPSKHPPGTHEVAAGARVIEYCLEHLQNSQSFAADVIDEWPVDGELIEGYQTVVLIGDSFPGERMENSDRIMEDLGRMMDGGCGMVTVHYGVGLKNEDMGPDGDHSLLHWTGGYFAAKCDHHQSVARIYEAATIELADPGHPVGNGVESFTFPDEPYIKNYFGPDERMLPGAFPVATSMLPPEDPREEIIAWGIERADGGRGIGITLPHFFKNWNVDPMRKLLLNCILWTAGEEIPAAGVETSLPPLESFAPESVEFVPRKK